MKRYIQRAKLEQINTRTSVQKWCDDDFWQSSVIVH
jgi:hypothetical protein